MPVERVQRMENSMQISNKLSSSEVINECKDVTDELFNYDTPKEAVGYITTSFEGNRSVAMYDYYKMMLYILIRIPYIYYERFHL